MAVIAGVAALLSGIGVAQAVAGAAAVGRFAAAGRRTAEPGSRRAPAPASTSDGISVLKPLHGDEPLLEQALASVCAQDYPAFQVVFGVQDATDTALPVVERVRARFPDRDIAVVVDPAQHGANRKVGNLINMLPAVKYDILAIADSDLHVQPDYLDRIAETLAEPGTGLVTTLYAGLPAADRLVQRIGATAITHTFLPGAVLARAMGRQDCLGATMVLRRATLARIGGLQSLVEHLADDQVLGRRVAALGLTVRLAHTVPATTVPEATPAALLRHELRWARTIRTLEPAAFAASVLQYPLFWALLAVLFSAASLWTIGLFLLVWVGRALAATAVDRALEPYLAAPAGAANPPHGSSQGLAFPCPVWLLPLRDLISVGVMLASYAGRRVEWRGHHQIADSPGRIAPGPTASKEVRPR